MFPLDPLVLPVLVRIFQRFGQNERSLFSFLCSYEPFGLRAFSNSPLNSTCAFFRLADFYDYVRTNFGHRLAVASYRTHWNVIESVIETRSGDNFFELQVLKTIGVLNLLDTDDLRPTKDAIAWSVGGNSRAEREKTFAALKKLVSARALHYRGEKRGYSLWPYTSVDIDARLIEAKRAIPEVRAVAKAIREQLDTRPIVARGHYIKTGNLRYFDVVYCEPDELQEQASRQHEGQADGVILVPLCETKHQNREARTTALALPPRDDLIFLIAVSRPLNQIGPAVLDAQRWEWIQENTQELNSDPLAREEVQLHLQEARNRLQTQIQEFIGLNRIGIHTTLCWYYRRKEIRLTNGREVMKWLSKLCNDVFKDAPLVRNELVNRHNLTPAANAARIRLIDLMFAGSDKPDLGLATDRKPPEKSMYLSVLKASGLHRREHGRWKLDYPPKDDEANLLPTLKEIRRMVSDRPDSRVPITELLDKLRRPPFGLRNGLFPILLAVVAIADQQEIAFYENGTFLRDIGRDAFLRMTKAPEKFDIQHCKIEGVRSELFTRLVQILELPSPRPKKVELLDVVRTICDFVAKVPLYTRNTARLSPTAVAVRNAILEARQPVHLVFHDLPTACGFSKFELGGPASTRSAREFVARLRDALSELRMAFAELQRRISKTLSVELGYDGQLPSVYRTELSKRAERLLLQVNESKLKAFAFRLFDVQLSDSEWINSIGAFLTLRPPDRWIDSDEDTFGREILNIIGRFKHAESIGFSQTARATGLRVAVTRSDGSERQEVVYVYEREKKALSRLEVQIEKLIVDNRRIGIAAASRVIWSHLNSEVD